MITLKPGDKAPQFEGKDQQGNLIKSSDYAGKKLVIYFYPKDNTPGCTAQSCNLRDNYAALQQAGYHILGVSQDSEKSHQKFIEKFDLPFPLLADTDHKVHEKFGTWGEKSMYGKTYMGTLRTTFVINEEGIIDDVITKVNTKDHTSQIMV